MTHKTKAILTAVLIGIVVALCLVIPFASVRWFNNNPAYSEIEEIIDEKTLFKDDANALKQTTIFVMVLDFAYHLIYFAGVAAIVGGVVGFICGHLWYQRNLEEGTDL
jgi:hypothetical protein